MRDFVTDPFDEKFFLVARKHPVLGYEPLRIVLLYMEGYVESRNIRRRVVLSVSRMQIVG